MQVGDGRQRPRVRNRHAGKNPSWARLPTAGRARLGPQPPLCGCTARTLCASVPKGGAMPHRSILQHQPAGHSHRARSSRQGAEAWWRRRRTLRSDLGPTYYAAQTLPTPLPGGGSTLPRRLDAGINHSRKPARLPGLAAQRQLRPVGARRHTAAAEARWPQRRGLLPGGRQATRAWQDCSHRLLLRFPRRSDVIE